MKKLILLIAILFSTYSFSQTSSLQNSAGHNEKKDSITQKIELIVTQFRKDMKGGVHNDRKLQYTRRLDSCIAAIDTSLKKKYKELASTTSQIDKGNKRLADSIDNRLKNTNPSTPITINRNETQTNSKAKAVEMETLIKAYQKDSVELDKLTQMVIGRPTLPGVYASYFQGIPAWADDNPKSYSFYQLNFSMPLNRWRGKFKSFYTAENSEKKQEIQNPNLRPYVGIWLRNLDFTFTGVFSKKGLYANVLTRFDTIDKRLKSSSFINLLDLKQNAFFSMTANLNLFTIINEERGLTLYFDVFCSWSRTTIAKPTIIYIKDSVTSIKNSDSMCVTNFLQYGLNFTMKTKIKKSPVNFRINTQLFWIDPSSNTFSLLNPQFNKLPYLTPQDKKPYEFKPNYTAKNLEAYPYFAMDLTIKYNIGLNSTASVSKTSSSSPISSSTPNFLYLSFGYYSSINFIGKHRDVNNYMTLQIGYSMDLNSVIKTLQTALGLTKSGS